MEGPLGLLAVMVGAVFIVGPILGIIAFFGNRSTRDRADRLERELADLRQRMRSMESGLPGIPTPAAAASPLTPAAPAPHRTIDDVLAVMGETTSKQAPGPMERMVGTSMPDEAQLSLAATEQTEVGEPVAPAAFENANTAEALAGSPTESEAPGTLIPPPLAPPLPPPVAPAPPRVSLPTMEMNLGTKWLGWVGGVLLIMCAAFFLKYAYENAWIGPKGRLAIGVLCGVGAIVLGERFRRRDWLPLFQTLTGIGLATFYICIFFSYKIYHLSGPGPSFVAAIGVSMLAVALAVFHNTVSIAILAVIGGFLSPVLLSTGENHPYVLFLYIAALNLIAMGAAYFRRWHALELLCFAGTAVMMMGWYEKFGKLPDQMQPALIFVSLFYLMFLVIPTLHTLVRGLPDSREGTILVILNALFSAVMYYRLLYPAHSHALGFIVLGQAAMVFVLFRAWSARVGQDNNTAHSLLVIALALIIGAVPLHLSRYGVPVVWALEGALLAYAGTRFRSGWTQGMAVVALTLATFALLRRLPLHTAMFTPIFNASFGSWLLVAASAMVASWLLWNRSAPEDSNRQALTAASFLLGFGLTWYLLTLEVTNYWRWNYVGHQRDHYTMASILVLWSVLSAAVVTTLSVRNMLHDKWETMAAVLFLFTGLAFLAGLHDYKIVSTMLFVNTAFLTRMVFCASLWWAARCFAHGERGRAWRSAFETSGFIALAIVLALELPRWSFYSGVVSQRMAFSLISVAWAMLAFGLIWFGLASRDRLRRVLGFVLFAVVVLKVLFVDTSELEKVYRIVSFGATGALLLAAGYFFQKYSAMLLQESEREENP
ncbi:MAG: DUF2339 domain-containing protein [Candidatus Sumerlaeaceae bacterium]